MAKRLPGIFGTLKKGYSGGVGFIPKNTYTTVAVEAGHTAPTGVFHHHHEHHGLEVLEKVPDILYGKFGTLTDPVIVPSLLSDRIVGCLGRTNEDGHIILWHTVGSDKPTVCLECGQTFKLRQVKLKHDHDHDSHGHQDHAHEHDSHSHKDHAHAHPEAHEHQPKAVKAHAH